MRTAGALLLLLGFAAWPGYADGPGSAEQIRSEKGGIVASFESALDPLVINRMHSWVVHLENLQGEPLSDHEISITGGMPEHDHGLPTEPRITTYLGAGDYLLEGMKFHMNGVWTITLVISHPAAEETDTVIFQVEL